MSLLIFFSNEYPPQKGGWGDEKKKIVPILFRGEDKKRKQDKELRDAIRLAMGIEDAPVIAEQAAAEIIEIAQPVVEDNQNVVNLEAIYRIREDVQKILKLYRILQTSLDDDDDEAIYVLMN